MSNLTSKNVSHPAVAAIGLSMAAVHARRAKVANPAFSANKTKVEEAIKRLVDITNAAIKEQFKENIPLIRKLMIKLDKKRATRCALGQRIIKADAKKLELLKKLWDFEVTDLVPLHVDGTVAIQKIQNSTNANEVNKLIELIDTDQVFFDNQIRTMVRLLFFVLLNPKRAGIIVGALQSGKTGIGMAIKLMMAPMLYLLTGVRIYPHFISTNQTSHQNQSKKALDAFVKLYGDIEFYATREDEEAVNLGGYFRAFNALVRKEMDKFQNNVGHHHDTFSTTPTISTYKETVAILDDTAMSSDELNSLDDVMIRTPGESVNAVRRLMEIAQKNTFYLLLILDEPQWGASGNYAAVNSKSKLSGGVLNQMFFDDIKDIVSHKNMHMLVGLSASPFGFTDAEKLFSIPAYLPDNYSGPNCFAGELLDPSKPNGLSHAPRIYDWDNLGKETGIADVNTLAEMLRGRKLTAKDGDVDPEQFRIDNRIAGGKLLYELYYNLVSDKDNPSHYGMLLRGLNNNTNTDKMAREAELDKYFTVVRFYYETVELSENLKQELAKLRYLGKPVLILVTAKARLGDSFPSWIELFMDFSKSNGDMNAKLQGVFGRACGVNKPHSKVIVNSGVAYDLRQYIITNGAYKGAKSSPHSIRTNSQRAKKSGAQCAILGIGASEFDPAVRHLLRDIEANLNMTPDAVADIKSAEADTTLDISKIVSNNGIVDYINDRWSVFFPQHVGKVVGVGGHTKNDKFDKLVWPSADGRSTVIVRHSTPLWYQNPANHNTHNNKGEKLKVQNREKQSFETHNRYYLVEREARKRAKRSEDFVMLTRGHHTVIDTFLDDIEAETCHNGKDRKNPSVSMTNARLKAVKDTVEANYQTMFDGKFSKVELIALPGDLWRNEFLKEKVELPTTPICDGFMKMRTTSNGEAPKHNRVKNGEDKGTIMSMIVYQGGKVASLAWPANTSTAPDNTPDDTYLNIQVNCGKFDANDNEIVDAATPGVFRVTSVCLPLEERMTHDYSNEEDALVETNFIAEGMSKKQIAARNAQRLANGQQPTTRPVINPVPATKRIEVRKVRRSRFTVTV